ncbi:hypothetical protein QE152_g32298 [Popillia japonica]|uniref:Uncharacterized protein n=1 Tax=Popillia japonica TaxID=7064 RepID=A0AAW1IZX6_POPJA
MWTNWTATNRGHRKIFCNEPEERNVDELDSHKQRTPKDILQRASIPLSSRSNTRRTEILAADHKSSLLELLQKAPCYAIALDQKYDIADEEQMFIFVQFLDIECKTFREGLLAMLPFTGKTLGEDLFQAFDDFMKKSNIRYDRMVSGGFN